MKTKKCPHCILEKTVNLFSKEAKKSDGLATLCKECAIRYQKKYREKNCEKIISKRKEKYSMNIESEREKGRNNRDKNKEKINERRRLNYLKNREKILNQVKKYAINNRYKINESYNKRRKTDELFKLSGNLRGRIYEIFKYHKFKRGYKSESILGISYIGAKEYIEKMFADGMSWSNYGEWHIDHIKPISCAKNKDELISLCHYTNLQPLWKEDNLRKQNKPFDIYLKSKKIA